MSQHGWLSWSEEINQHIERLTSRVSILEKGQANMIQQVQDLVTAANSAVATLNAVAAALRAGTVSPADLVAVQAAKDALVAATTAAQSEVTPA